MTVSELQGIGWRLMSELPVSFDDGRTLYFVMSDPMGSPYFVECDGDVREINRAFGERVLH